MSSWPLVVPPVKALSAELRYVLLRAFGPRAAVAGVVEPALVRSLARGLDLAGRIGARVPLEQLARELDRATAVSLFQQQALQAAQAEARARHVDRVVAVAAQEGTPVALLKGAALERLGLVAPGGRRAGDADLLVPKGAARGLQQRLLAAGWSTLGLPGYAHQLAPLRDRDGLVLELHVSLPGLRKPGQARDADFECLAEAGLLGPGPRQPGRAHTPVLALARGHALVHGLWQHGLQPQAYPPARVLADAQDLGLAECSGQAVLSDWIEPRVPGAARAALQCLLLRLAAGDLELSRGEARPPERLLLDHVLAGAFDLAYRRRLRRRELLRDLRSPRLVWHALFPTAAQLEIAHGKAPSRAARLGRRWRRPVDLLLALPRLLGRA